MQMILSISVGAVIGALSRHYLMEWVTRITGGSFPWGTLMVNVIGSLLMGVLIELLALKFSLTHHFRALLTVGILGSFTTFSTFSLDAASLIQRGETVSAIIYALASVLTGIGALFAGIHFVRLLVE